MQLAGVNTSSVTSENYVRHGKLLALELLVKVFENPGHRWENVRVAFCEQLRFPLCLVLIRNCNPAETKVSYTLILTDLTLFLSGLPVCDSFVCVSHDAASNQTGTQGRAGCIVSVTAPATIGSLDFGSFSSHRHTNWNQTYQQRTTTAGHSALV